MRQSCDDSHLALGLSSYCSHQRIRLKKSKTTRTAPHHRRLAEGVCQGLGVSYERGEAAKHGFEAAWDSEMEDSQDVIAK